MQLLEDDSDAVAGSGSNVDQTLLEDDSDAVAGSGSDVTGNG